MNVGSPMSSKKPVFDRILIVAVLSLTCTNAAVAQLEEIIVTAEKRSKSVQNVAIAINAFSEESLKNFGFTEPRDLMYQTPGLIVSYAVGTNLPNFALRGVGLNEYAANNSSPVAIHLDEVYLSSAAMLNFGLFDFERVEVLKGPQGTLFGRNTTGGAVNFFSNGPTREFEAGITGTYGNYENLRGEGYISGPLSDTVSARVAGFYTTQGDGPWFNRPRNKNIGEIEYAWGVRGQLLYEPTDSLSFNLNVHAGNEKSEGGQYNMLPSFALDFSDACPAYYAGTLSGGEPDCINFNGNQEPDDGPFANGAGVINRQELEGFGTTLTINWSLENMDIVSITAHESLDRFAQEDADGFIDIATDTVYIEDMNQYSQELRLVSSTDSSLEWILGGIWAKEEIDTPTHQGDFTDDVQFPANINASYVQNSESFAVFGQATWSFSEQWRLTTGLRYTEETREFAGGTDMVQPVPMTGLGLVGLPFDPPIVFSFVDDSIDFTDLSGKIGVDYSPNDDMLFYGSVSKGFKSGGFNGSVTFTNEELEPFDEEILYSYEVGYKIDLADDRVRWNGAIFYYDYHDVILAGQDVTFAPNGTPLAVLRSSNLSDAKVAGIEIDLWFHPSDGLDIQFGAAYTHSELVNPKPGNEALEGNRLTYTPEFQGNWLVRYETALGQSNLFGAIQLDGTYKGSFFAEIDNGPTSEIGDYALLNGRFSLYSDSGNWVVALWGQNLTDETYLQYVNDLTFINGSVLSSASYPRTYGIELSYNW